MALLHKFLEWLKQSSLHFFCSPSSAFSPFLLIYFLSSEAFFRLKPVTYVIPNSNPVSIINGNIIEKLLEFKENFNEEEMD